MTQSELLWTILDHKPGDFALVADLIAVAVAVAVVAEVVAVESSGSSTVGVGIAEKSFVDVGGMLHGRWCKGGSGRDV